VPYVPWMSGKEALLHIVQAEGCTFPEAIEQLKAAIGDRKVDAARASPPHQLIGAIKEITPSGEAKGSMRLGGFGLSFPHPGPLPFRVKRENVLRIWPNPADAPIPTVTKPETEGPHETARPRPIHDGIKKAIDAIWPDGVPAGLKSKERDLQIRAWLVSYRHSVPASNQSLARAVQRELRDRRPM
jgi:hypothetical protein